MILITIGLLLGICGIFVFKRVIYSKSEKLHICKSAFCVLDLFVAVMLITFGFCGARIDEGEQHLKSTIYVVSQKQEDGMYEVLNEDNNTLYYFDDAQVEVLKDGKRGMYGNKVLYECDIVEKECEQPYIEIYEVDHKMNIWSFELINDVRYVLYIPQK